MVYDLVVVWMFGVFGVGVFEELVSVVLCMLVCVIDLIDVELVFWFVMCDLVGVLVLCGLLVEVFDYGEYMFLIVCNGEDLVVVWFDVVWLCVVGELFVDVVELIVVIVDVVDVYVVFEFVNCW